jgi:hypothetical protein
MQEKLLMKFHVEDDDVHHKGGSHYQLLHLACGCKLGGKAFLIQELQWQSNFKGMIF